MKYLKHTIALLCFSFMALFVVVMAAIKITTLFSGSITIFYSIQLALEVLLSLGIILWMKRGKTSDNVYRFKMEVVLSDLLFPYFPFKYDDDVDCYNISKLYCSRTK